MTEITAKHEEFQEEVVLDNDAADEVTTEEVVVENKVKRQRRVTSDITLPEAGSSIATISLDVAGIGEIINYQVDFATMDESFVRQAALAGMVSRLGIAYSGITDPQEIVAAINDELDKFSQGKFVSRSSSDRAVNAPDIVIAWIRAVNKNPEDKATLAVYLGAWKDKSEAEKAKIKTNELVATIFEQMQYEKRMAKVEQVANADESVLEL